MVWLGDQSKTQAAVGLSEQERQGLFIEDALAGDEIELKLNSPTHDSRTPNIFVQPVYGTIYTGSSEKNAEQGGTSFGDVNVGLIVSNPRLQGATIKTPVLTSQVAPTILRALGIDPENLNSVRVERTTVLPGLFDRN